MKLSVCIPVYNGAETIENLVHEVKAELSSINLEVVLVNDGSRDNSEEVCIKLAKENDFVRFLALRKNFGEHNAVMCALNYCTGDYAVIIDDDFQNPPSEIIKLLDEIEKGYDVVYSKYAKKRHNLFRNFGSKVNDLFSCWLLNKPKSLYLCSFKIINRGMIDEIIRYTGPFPYIDGLILRATSNISSVLVEHDKRQTGASNYTLGKLLSLWLNMSINFSIKPMRVISVTGLTICFASIAGGIYFLVERLRDITNTVPGWASLVLLILFFGGIQSFFLGIIGEYIAKNYLANNGTPQWVVKGDYSHKRTIGENIRRKISEKKGL